ncbi:MAG: hypothetical protein HQL33_07105, partial [Alphaproteobacteria bacterium]|nr:hypothetical protein [Alphaproteobacteria bacterium]
MAVQSLIVKLESANQVAQASALVGKTATVHQVATGAGGLATKMVLLPPGGAGAGGTGGLVVKLEGLRQASEVAGLVGQKVTVGAIPSALGKVGGSWLVLKPVGAGVASSKLTMVAAAATLPAAAAVAPAASAAATPAASAAVAPAAKA